MDRGGGTSTTTVAYGETALYGSIPEKAATAQYTYTFAGWSATEGGEILDTNAMVVEGEATYYAVFTSDVNKYLVKFVDEEGTILDSQTLDYGSAVEYKGVAPEKAATVQYTYTYAGWTDSEGVDYSLAETLPTVVGEATYTVKFSSTVNKYEITWNVNGTETKVEVEYGATPAFDGTPAIDPTVEYQWNFKGWSTEENGTVADLATVTGAETYYAIFERTTREYAIVWNVDGVLTNTSFVAGVVPSNELSPAREATAKYTYTFAGWAKEADGEVIDLATDLVDGDQTYYAIFNSTVNKYTVTFYNEDGETVLQAVDIEYDAVAAYPTDVDAPSKAATPKYTYTYAGWTDGTAEYKPNELPVVTGDASYTVIFSESINRYTVTVNYVVAGEGEKPANPSSQSVTLDYGTIYNEDNSPVSPTVEGYLPDYYYFGGIVTEDVTYTVTYGKASVWDGTYPDTATYTLEGEGTEASPYLIQSAQDLAYLSEASKGVANYGAGLSYKVTKNIDLAEYEWKPIGADGTTETKYAFAGTFDGNGHTISGMKISSGLNNTGFFGTVSGTVKNLTVQGTINGGKWLGGIAGTAEAGSVYENIVTYVDITAGTEHTANVYAGGISGRNKGSTYINCANYGDIISYGARNSGFVGSDDSSTAGTVYTSCINYGDVTGVTHNNGGFIGIVNMGLTLTNCVNYGAITSTSSTATSIGGLVAQIYSHTSNIKNCYNYGSVTSAGGNIGGIVGYVAGNATATVENCDNYGAVKSTTNAKKYTGGIVGYEVKGCTLNVTNCDNYGEIKATSNAGGILGYGVTFLLKDCINYGTIDSTAYDRASAVGGIVGWMSGADAKAENVTNYGDVIGDTNYSLVDEVAYGAVTHGGIAGYGSGSIDGAINYGNVYAAQQSAGIIGSCNNGIIKNVKNYGDVSSGEMQSGERAMAGICGWHTGTTATNNAYNYGDISGYTNIGGAIGYAGAATGVTNIYNYGDVYGSDATGGIGGHINAAISDSHNEGNVYGMMVNIGGIAGYNALTITNCTNKGNVYGNEDVGGIVGDANGADVEQVISGCTNSGNVYGVNRTGGIAGNTFKTAVTNCTNNGNVGVNGEMSDDVYATAGIVGHATNNTVITDCTNNGAVTGDNVVGGIAGYLGAAGETLPCSQIVDCVNTGVISGQDEETTGDLVGNNKGEIIFTEEETPVE